MSTARIRLALDSDLPAVAALAAQLVRMHHAVDPDRFFLPDRVEEGYVWWLGRELKRREAAVLVAEIEGEIAGYAYGTIEDRNWNALLDRHGAIHDLLVRSDARGRGVGRQLLSAIVAELEGAGAPRIVLQTMVSNEAAQRLFAGVGFRATMLEMTRSRAPVPGEGE